MSTRSVYIYVLNVDDDTTEAPLLIMLLCSTKGRGSW